MQLIIHHLPSAGDTLPSAVRTKCVILVFLAFLFWLPTSISILVVPWTSGHIMAMVAHDLAFEGESTIMDSLCTTANERIGFNHLSFTQAEMKIGDKDMFRSSNESYRILHLFV